MNINPKFFVEFEKKVSKCDENCKHHYQKHIFKDGTYHYKLICSVHGFRMHVPRRMAEAQIALGAPYDDNVRRTEDPTS